MDIYYQMQEYERIAGMRAVLPNGDPLSYCLHDEVDGLTPAGALMKGGEVVGRWFFILPGALDRTLVSPRHIHLADLQQKLERLEVVRAEWWAKATDYAESLFELHPDWIERDSGGRNEAHIQLGWYTINRDREAEISVSFGGASDEVPPPGRETAAARVSYLERRVGRLHWATSLAYTVLLRLAEGQLPKADEDSVDTHFTIDGKKWRALPMKQGRQHSWEIHRYHEPRHVEVDDGWLLREP